MEEEFSRYGTRHGSPNGLRRHQTLDTPPCDLCIAAQKNADRRYRLTRVENGKEKQRTRARALALKRLRANHKAEWQRLLLEAQNELRQEEQADTESVG